MRHLSWYFPARISAADQQALNKRETNFADSQGFFTFAGTGFAETNYKFSVNGYLYGDGPVMTVTQGQRVRWYLTYQAEYFSARSLRELLDNGKKRRTAGDAPA